MRIHKSTQGGFTIIELMIVLGIAALILAGVLIAVPALQRNQRNSSRRADIQYLMSAIATYQGNNNNDLPTSLTEMTNSVTNNDDEAAYYPDWSTIGDWNFINADDTQYTDGANAAVALTAANSLSITDQYDVWLDGGTAGTAGTSDPGHGTDPLPDEEHFDIFFGFNCNQDSLTLTGRTGNYPGINTFVHEDGLAREFAVVYTLEGANIWYCQDNA